MDREVVVHDGIEVQFVRRPPLVVLAGMTKPVGAFEYYLRYRGITWETDKPLDETDALLEAAGRVCYQSWDNPAKRTRDVYLSKQIIGNGHHSVLEHVWFNFIVADVPRSTQLELVRHRVGTAYSWESTRFTSKFLRFIVPPRIRNDIAAVEAFKAACLSAVSTYFYLVDRARRETDQGTLKRKRALEAARSVLPNALGSDGMVSVNVRALRHIVSLRSDEAADLSIREFVQELFSVAANALPPVFVDALTTHNGSVKFLGKE